jgi:hypothetical protein
MSGKRPSRTLAVTAVCVLLVIPAGCGGSSSPPKVSASAYVGSVCTALSGLVSSLKGRVAQIKQTASLGATRTPAQAKAQIVSLFALAIADSLRAIDQIKAAGVPNVSNGQQISSGLVAAFNAVKSALAKTQAQANQLPTSDPTTFQAAVSLLGPSLQASLAAGQAGFQGLNSPALSSAANSSPACQRLKALEASATSGPSGPTGTSGTSGPGGASGTSGPGGASGTSGPTP